MNEYAGLLSGNLRSLAYFGEHEPQDLSETVGGVGEPTKGWKSEHGMADEI